MRRRVVVRILQGTNGNDVLTGDPLDNNLFLGLGNGRDVATGGALADRFMMTVDHNVDRIDGGAGEDTIDFRGSDHQLHINLSTGEVDANFGGSGLLNVLDPPKWAEVAQVHNVEDVVGSRFDDTITGSSASNRLDGGAGNDVIHAGAGNDTLIGGTGNNLLDGGSGSDTADYSSSAHSVFAMLNNGGGGGEQVENFTSDTHYSQDTFVSIENLTGSAQNDWLIGDANANVINGGGGDDQLDGHGGGDTIHGGLGDDYVNEAGASGVNHLFGDEGNDHIFGGDGGNIIDGGAGNDGIYGGSGNDVINGGDGDDFIDGSSLGLDTLDGGTGVNTLSYMNSNGGVVVNLAANTASGGSATGDVISNFQNVAGSDHNDLLIGSNQDNVLFERFGTNTLVGGGGHDTFAFMDFTESHNLVLDFHVGEDKLAIVGDDTLADLHFTQTATGTLVSFDNSQATIMLAGVNAQDFAAHASTNIEFSQTLDPLLHG
jgi:Ca2+-binding RTX toxin-like protein